MVLDACRVLKFTAAEEGRYLEHHVIQSILVDDNDFCQMKCYVEQTCSSYNLGSMESRDKFVCELSDSDHYQHPGDLVFKKGFSYHPAVVSILFQQVLTNRLKKGFFTIYKGCLQLEKPLYAA